MLTLLLDVPDILRRIIEKLPLRQVLRLGAVNKACHAFVEQNRHVHAPRLLISSSANRLVVEINPENGSVVTTAPVRVQGKRKFGTPNRMKGWHTGMAFSPYDGDLYICQYSVNGVMVLHGESLQYRRQFVSRIKLAAPEGIAFAKRHLYVCSAVHGTVSQVSLTGALVTSLSLAWPPAVKYHDDGSLRGDPVPWGMTVGPDAALYIAVDASFEARSYDAVPSHTTGNVMRIPLADDGSFVGSVECFCDEGILKRPSGVCFDSQNDLYVTSLTDEVLLFAGPGKAGRGKLLRTVVRASDGGLSHPWDVKWFGGKLLVTTHTAFEEVGEARVNLYEAATGKLLWSCRSPCLNQPNMIAMEGG